MAERSTLESLRDMDIDDAPSSSAGAGPKPPSKSNGDSLLASLLNETSDEANRELLELQERLREKRHAEEESRRREEDARRRTLDTLREQEARRREDKIREREGGPAPVTKAQPVAAFVAPAIVAAPKKSYTSWIIAGVALIVAGGAGVGWYLTSEAQKAEAQKAQSAADEAAKKAAAEVASAKAAAKPAAPVAAPAPIIVVKAPPVEGRDTEQEQGAFERRQLEVVAAVVAPEVVAKPTGRTGPRHTGPKPEPTTRADGKPRIKVGPLDLGGGR